MLVYLQPCKNFLSITGYVRSRATEDMQSWAQALVALQKATDWPVLGSNFLPTSWLGDKTPPLGPLHQQTGQTLGPEPAFPDRPADKQTQG